MEEVLGDDENEQSSDEESSGIEDDSSSEGEDPVYTGERDADGDAHGQGVLTYHSGAIFKGGFSHGLKLGLGCFFFTDGSVLEGYYEKNSLTGRAVYRYSDRSLLVGTYRHGELNGPAEEYDYEGDVIFRGQYTDNIRSGFCWYSFKDGGCIAGRVDRNGRFTGNDIAYIYPDLNTALYGRFDNGVMVAAKLARLDGKSKKDLPNFAIVEDNVVYYQDVSTRTKISKEPIVQDPYEKSWVYVKDSTIPGAGEGLFSRVYIPEGAVISYYNGVRLQHDEVDERDWSKNSNTISIDENHVIDVPSQFSDIEFYRATLGHKANHCFTPNAHYEPCEHPRFGSVKCVRMLKSVDKDTEITVAYDYDHHALGPGQPEAPDWYKQLLNKNLPSVTSNGNQDADL